MSDLPRLRAELAATDAEIRAAIHGSRLDPHFWVPRRTAAELRGAELQQEIADLEYEQRKARRGY